jgi:hypothetical protein
MLPVGWLERVLAQKHFIAYMGSFYLGYRLPMGDTGHRQSRTRLAIYLVIVAVVAIVVMASYAVLVIMKDDYQLEESDGALIYEVQDLPGGFYQIWDNAFLSIYSGEKTYDGNLVVYPIQGGWGLNSSRLTGAALIAADFGARDIGGSWFNLTITDVTGDGRIGDGDHLRIYSLNGTFSNDTVYFMRFGASAHGGIAPFYIVFGFEFSSGSFDSWVEWGPNEYAM